MSSPRARPAGFPRLNTEELKDALLLVERPLPLDRAIFFFSYIIWALAMFTNLVMAAWCAVWSWTPTDTGFEVACCVSVQATEAVNAVQAARGFQRADSVLRRSVWRHTRCNSAFASVVGQCCHEGGSTCISLSGSKWRWHYQSTGLS